MQINRVLVDVTRQRDGYVLRIRCNVSDSHASVLEEVYHGLSWPELAEVLDAEFEWRRPGYEVDEGLRWVQIPLEGI